MWALLLPVLAKLLPYLIGVIAIAGAYFGIKQKGVQQERQRQEVAQQKAAEQVQQQIAKAESKDEAIDAKAVEAKHEIEKANPAPGDLKPGSDVVF